MSAAIVSQFPARPTHLQPVPRHDEQVQMVTKTRLRLTKRGRRVLIALVVVPIIIAAFFSALNGGGADATNTAVSDSSVYVTVQYGESLWQIAERIAPNSDPRDVIAELQSYNHISSQVEPGQRIAIPAQYAK